jgi:predicted transcriptional regulator
MLITEAKMKQTKSFRLPDDLVAALSAHCAKVERSEAWVVEKALREYLAAKPSDQPQS